MKPDNRNKSADWQKTNPSMGTGAAKTGAGSSYTPPKKEGFTNPNAPKTGQGQPQQGNKNLGGAGHGGNFQKGTYQKDKDKDK